MGWFSSDNYVSFFVTLHFVTFGAEVAALGLLLNCNYVYSGVILATLLLTGSFCTYAAWNCSRPKSCAFGCLPMKDARCWVKYMCCLPLVIGCGCCQGIMLPLTISDKREEEKGNSNTARYDEHPTVKGFHCKAVIGLIEGINCSAVILYAYLGIQFPKNHDPLTVCRDPLDDFWMRITLIPIGLICFTSGGLGILELDYCMCFNMDASLKHGGRPRETFFFHWLYRVCELVSRVSLHVAFVLLTWKWAEMHSDYWWVPWTPTFLSLCVSTCFVCVLGGNEVNSFVRLLCGIPCTFVDLFRFVDSPYKRRSAERLSRAITYRHVVELIFLPYLLVCLLGLDDVLQELEYLRWKNPYSLEVMLLSVPAYFLLFWKTTYTFLDTSPGDIFVACEKCDVDKVRELTKAILGIDVNRFDAGGMTSLMRAIVHGESDSKCASICRVLIRAGAKVDLNVARESLWIRRVLSPSVRRRWTALHFAARRGSKEVIVELFNGVNSSLLDENAMMLLDLHGDTPLHVAVQCGHVKVARYMAEKRPDWVSQVNSVGKTPSNLAHSPAMKEVFTGSLDWLNGNTPKRVSSNLTQGWEFKQIPIRHAGSREPCLAPGLCSYVMGCGGGPLCRVFLAPIPEDTLHTPGQQAIDGFRGRFSTASSMVRPSLNSIGASDDEEDDAVGLSDMEPVSCVTGEHFTRWRTMRTGDQDPSILYDAAVRTRAKEAVLGEGAYGMVWRAKSSTTGISYAIKTINTHSAKKAVVAQRELKIADMVRTCPHPCIVGLLRVEEFADTNLLILVMEFCAKGDLEKVIVDIRTSSPNTYQPPIRCLGWLAQVFLGLEHLHKNMGVLLRDLKPANIVLDRNYRAKLTDFGFGRFGQSTSGVWSFRAPPGSPGYVSPEVLREEAHDEKADLYSFGVLAWMLLTGGLTNRDSPMPPTNTGGCAKRVSSCYDDYLCLQQAIESPEENQALPLPSQASKDLILGLSQRDPSKRPDHTMIRSSDFFEALSEPFPPLESGFLIVESWLEKQGF
eukprot:TRINITY_DN49897_c0_g1_i1.p1 TRINITY_DN49897_c0_g1~~TRINITY_DN49897_c0_g1_i1.p1  ORF type:complete len:1019 (-),score=125.39 TRINITY_DN49897_c0_g1_i1:172-3228(-)